MEYWVKKLGLFAVWILVVVAIYWLGEADLNNIPFFSNLYNSIYLVAQILAVVLLVLLAALLVLWAVLLMFWLAKGTNEITILPFETASGEDKYSGRAIANMFITEWQNILRIHRAEIPGIASEQLTAAQRIAPSKEEFSASMGNIATAGVGQTKVSVGQLLVTLKKLWPGKQGAVLVGSFQRYGQVVNLAVRMESSEMRAWEVSRKVGSDDEVSNLVKDLVFKVLRDLGDSSKDSPDISAKTWEGFKYFTKAREAYWRYQITRRGEDLEEARSCSIRAVQEEEGSSYAKPQRP